MRNGLKLIKEFEGCRLTAYKDIVGVWTIGWGDTKGVYEGQVITQEEADSRLMIRYDEFEQSVKHLLTTEVSENQLGAIVCFAYNLGLGALKSSTLLKKINSGDSSATQEFLRWNKAGGKEVAGLTRRRKAEVSLFVQ